MRSDGTGLRAITQATVDGPTRFSLSPDGSKVAYTIGAANHGQIHVVDVETGAESQVAFDGTRPTCDPTGRQMGPSSSSSGPAAVPSS